jgi:hypothetical protein
MKTKLYIAILAIVSFTMVLVAVPGHTFAASPTGTDAAALAAQTESDTASSAPTADHANQRVDNSEGTTLQLSSDIGTMADRILLTEGQIGVMADRIVVSEGMIKDGTLQTEDNAAGMAQK